MTYKWSTRYRLLKNTELTPDMWTAKPSKINGMQRRRQMKREIEYLPIYAHFLL